MRLIWELLVICRHHEASGNTSVSNSVFFSQQKALVDHDDGGNWLEGVMFANI